MLGHFIISGSGFKVLWGVLGVVLGVDADMFRPSDHGEEETTILRLKSK